MRRAAENKWCTEKLNVLVYIACLKSSCLVCCTVLASSLDSVSSGLFVLLDLGCAASTSTDETNRKTVVLQSFPARAVESRSRHSWSSHLLQHSALVITPGFPGMKHGSPALLLEVLSTMT